MKRISGNKVIIGVIIAFLIIFIFCLPMILNYSLLDWRAKGTNGTLDSWLVFFATYYGAIIGGIISGLLTLMGVRLTINRELTIQTTRDKLFDFYHPVDNVINSFAHKHGAHNFTDLSLDEQANLMTMLSENIVYADSEMYLLIIEMQWAFKGNDYQELNERYTSIGIAVNEHLHDLREQLKLPKIDLEHL